MANTQDDVAETRVQISTQIDIGNGIEEIELPFGIAVFSDLSGDSDNPPPDPNERGFTSVTQESFDQFMKAIAPALNLQVPDHLTETGKLEMLRLVFTNMGGFRPEDLVKQGSMRQLKELRDLFEKLASMIGGTAAQAELSRALQEFTKLIGKKQ